MREEDGEEAVLSRRKHQLPEYYGGKVKRDKARSATNIRMGKAKHFVVSSYSRTSWQFGDFAVLSQNPAVGIRGVFSVCFVRCIKLRKCPNC